MFNFLKRKKDNKEKIMYHNASILWDLENIPVNNVQQATDFIKWLKDTAPGKIHGIGQLSFLKDEVRNRLKQYNVLLKDATSKKPQFADIAIINEAYRLSRENAPPHRFCFITKDGDFAETISQLRDWGNEVWLLTMENGTSRILNEVVDKILTIPREIFNMKGKSGEKSKDKTVKSSAKTVKSYQCAKCNGKFKSSQALKQHVDMKHGKNKCKYCNKTFSTEKALQDHQKSTHRLICPYCKQSFSTQKDRDHHIREKHKPFTCKTCNGRFASKKALDDHKRACSVK